MEQVTLIMLVGPPGSGKTTSIETLAEMYDAKAVSSDYIRKQMFGDENDQKHNYQVFALMAGMTLSALSQGVNVIYDATNVRRKDRLKLLRFLGDNVEKICYVFKTSEEECIWRDSKRERNVGPEVIHKFFKRFQLPTLDEGWNEIINVYSEAQYVQSEGKL